MSPLAEWSVTSQMPTRTQAAINAGQLVAWPGVSLHKRPQAERPGELSNALFSPAHTRVAGDRCDVLMLHRKLPPRLGVKAEKLDRGMLPGEHPVVRLHDDQRKLIEHSGLRRK